MHYHVIENDPGYLPDGDPAIFNSRADANRFATSQARELREAGYVVKGSTRDGYFHAERRKAKMGGYADRVIEITACDDPACLGGEGDFRRRGGHARTRHGGWPARTAGTAQFHNECDGSGPHTPGPVHRLELGGGAGVNLCHADWDYEMHFRRLRNRDLSRAAKFDILPWPGNGHARTRRHHHLATGRCR